MERQLLNDGLLYWFIYLGELVYAHEQCEVHKPSASVQVTLSKQSPAQIFESLHKSIHILSCLLHLLSIYAEMCTTWMY